MEKGIKAGSDMHTRHPDCMERGISSKYDRHAGGTYGNHDHQRGIHTR